MKWNLTSTFSTLPDELWTRVHPQPVKAPTLTIFNEDLARTLGLGAWEPEDLAILSGNKLAPNSDPIAQAYAGHQYAHFTTLGDGRAHLLGEQVTPTGERFDIQLKGSGPTPYSRRGDGRAALKPMLREFLISEAMHHLGIPTTRSLAVVETGEPVYRENVEKGAILTRVARSHIRIGTFEWAARFEGGHVLEKLTAYTKERHFRDEELFQSAMERQAKLMVQWMSVGFIHGVMNTDNMALSGETIDYGPCAFMDSYDPATVFSSIDHHGRYAYGRQAQIAIWNLARLGEILLPNEELESALQYFKQIFEREWLITFHQKLGFQKGTVEHIGLIERLFAWMYQLKADFNGTFRALANEQPPFRDEEFLAWHQDWMKALASMDRNKIAKKEMNKVNPKVIPRNHAVERALMEADEKGDLSYFKKILGALKTPFDDGETPEELSRGPKRGEEVEQTFCGT